MARRKFYRVEAFDKKEGRTIAGLQVPLWEMLRASTGISEIKDRDEYAKLIDKKVNEAIRAENKTVEALWTVISQLCNIPVANDYKYNKDDVCLYSPWTFFDDRPYMERANRLYIRLSKGRCCYVYKEMFIEDDDIYYEDNYQIIIPKSVYDKKKSKLHYF